MRFIHSAALVQAIYLSNNLLKFYLPLIVFAQFIKNVMSVLTGDNFSSRDLSHISGQKKVIDTLVDTYLPIIY